MSQNLHQTLDKVKLKSYFEIEIFVLNWDSFIFLLFQISAQKVYFEIE